MNYVVHAWMYLYYLLAGFGMKPSWGIIVTSLQIIQMFLGLYFIKKSESCEQIDMNNYYFGMLMYLSYVYLFVQFFTNQKIYLYFCTKKKKKKKEKDIFI